VIVVGRSNVDLGSRVPAVPTLGQTVFADDMAVTAGGKAFNQAVAVVRQGGRAALVSNVGDDAWGNMLADELAAAGVATAALRLLPGVPTGVAVVQVVPGGETAMVVAVSRGMELTAADVHVPWRPSERRSRWSSSTCHRSRSARY
jgi:ribokinase